MKNMYLMGSLLKDYWNPIAIVDALTGFNENDTLRNAVGHVTLPKKLQIGSTNINVRGSNKNIEARRENMRCGGLLSKIVEKNTYSSSTSP